MSTGAEHYREAERLLARAVDLPGEVAEAWGRRIAMDPRAIDLPPTDPAPEVAAMVAGAQVHATLALAAATATAMVVHACEVEADYAKEGYLGAALDEVTRREVDAWDDALGGERDE